MGSQVSRGCSSPYSKLSKKKTTRKVDFSKVLLSRDLLSNIAAFGTVIDACKHLRVNTTWLACLSSEKLWVLFLARGSHTELTNAMVCKILALPIGKIPLGFTMRSMRILCKQNQSYRIQEGIATLERERKTAEGRHKQQNELLRMVIKP